MMLVYLMSPTTRPPRAAWRGTAIRRPSGRTPVQIGISSSSMPNAWPAGRAESPRRCRARAVRARCSGGRARAAEELHVVLGHVGALRVADQVDLLGAGRAQHPGDERLQLLRAVLDLAHAAELVDRDRRPGHDAVGQGEHAVAVVGEQRRVGLPVGVLVAERAVHEYDGPRVGRARPAVPVVGAGRVGVELRPGGDRSEQEVVVDRAGRRRVRRRGRPARRHAGQEADQRGSGSERGADGVAAAHGCSSPGSRER